MSLSKTVKDRSRKWHAILFPENPDIETKIQKIEETLGMPRTEIFNYQGKLPGSMGLYALENAVTILHARIVDKMNSKNSAKSVGQFVKKGGTVEPVKKSDISVLCTYLLSQKAQDAWRGLGTNYRKSRINRNGNTVHIPEAGL